MQYFVITIFLILLQISDLTWASADKAQPYCDRNITDVTFITVTKTREVSVKKKGFINKLLSKTETKLDTYEEQEPVHKIRLDRRCCDGYKMSPLNLCEPQCVQNGCPLHSKCVEPEVCECKKGYFSTRSQHDNKHYCEPICEKTCPEQSACVGPNECACMKGYHLADGMLCTAHCSSGCPHNGSCVAPNVCECQEGFKSEHGTCIPICSLGDKCQNGKCVAKDKCECNYGYVLNTETLSCEAKHMKYQENQEFYFESSTLNYQEITISTENPPEISPEIETDIETDNDDIDPNEVFEEMFDSTTYGSTEEAEDSNSVVGRKCPEDYVYHQGECKPLKFASLEIDCRFKPCHDPHAICQENGTCSCTEGYKWFRMQQKSTLNNTVKAGCLLLSEYEAKLRQLQEDDTQKTVALEPANRALIFFIVLGVLIMVTALIYLLLKLLRSRRGVLDVEEAKNLSCAYDTKTCVVAEKSTI